MSLLRLPWAARHRRPVTSAVGFTGELPHPRSASFLLSFVLPGPIRPRGGSLVICLAGAQVPSSRWRDDWDATSSVPPAGPTPTHRFFFFFPSSSVSSTRSQGTQRPGLLLRPRDPSIQLPRPWPSISGLFDASIKSHLPSVLIGLSFLLYLLVLYLLIILIELSPSPSPATTHRHNTSYAHDVSGWHAGTTPRGRSRLCSAWKHSPSGGEAIEALFGFGGVLSYVRGGGIPCTSVLP